MKKVLVFTALVLGTGLHFSCTSDIESLGDILGDSSSSLGSNGSVFCRYATSCAEIPADACVAFGGTVVASCPVAGSSSFAGVSSSSPFGVLSSSSISGSSSSLQSGLVPCIYATGCAEMSADACIAFGGTIVTGGTILADGTLIAGGMIVASCQVGSSSSVIPATPSSSSVMPSSSSSGFYDLGNVRSMTEIGYAFRDIVNSADDGDCVYISFNWSDEWYLPRLRLTCETYGGGGGLSEMYCYDEQKRPMGTNECSFNTVFGINVWNICFNKRSSQSTNCWIS